MKEIQQRLSQIREQISSLESKGQNVKLIAVSKTKPSEMILEAYQAGQLLFGENKVQEAREKSEKLLLEQSKLEWHFIGALQKNKAKYCPGLFKTIHSLNRLDAAEILNQKCIEKDVDLEVLIQMNLTAESTKSGLVSEDDLKLFNDQLMNLPRLKIKGLMTIPDPTLTELETSRLYAQLYTINQREAVRLNLQNQMIELSMGMSKDYPLAIQEGATYVRVGTAIFGSRQQ